MVTLPQKKMPESAEEAYFLLMFLSLPHRVRHVPPAFQKHFSSAEQSVSHQTFHLHLAPPVPAQSMVSQEPVCGFASPQVSRYKMKDRLPLLSNSQASMS